MGQRPNNFKQGDLVRALKAAQKAGVTVARAEVGKDGKIVLVFNGGDSANGEDARNEWDE